MQTATPATPAMIQVADGDLICTPYDLGVMDAKDGMACDPEEYFERRSQRVDYCTGYIGVNPSAAAMLVLRHYARRAA